MSQSFLKLIAHPAWQHPSRALASFNRPPITDDVCGRCMRTDLEVRGDGTFALTTTNRGEAATRWLDRLQGKKPLAAVVADA